MRHAANLLCFLTIGVLASAQDEVRWADVPASPGASRVGFLSVPYAPTEGDVRLVEAAPQSNEMTRKPVPVFSVELEASSGSHLPAKDTAPDYPDGTRWPDSFGRIEAVLTKPGIAPLGGSVRNPWQGRVNPKSKGSENAFQCNGLIIGGEGGSIAFLNGRIVKRGDDVGKFRVSGIFAEGVVVESAALYFMIPVLRRTSISIREE
jgi:hypothetical protein